MIRRRILAVTRAVYGILVAGVLAWALWQARHSPSVWEQLATGPGQAAFVACWMVMAGMLGLAWARVVKVYLDLHLTAWEWLPIQGAAWAGRYLPGKLGLLAGKLSLATKADVSVGAITFSVLFEQVAFVATGIAIALIAPLPLQQYGIGMPPTGSSDTWHQLLRLLGTSAICILLIPSANIIASRMRVVNNPQFTEAAKILVLYLCAHVVAGLGLYLALRDVLPHNVPGLVYIISLLAAANVAGIIAFFAPAGLGVREAVLVVGLAPYMPASDALGLAALLRILTLFADIGFVCLTTGVTLLRRRASA